MIWIMQLCAEILSDHSITFTSLIVYWISWRDCNCDRLRHPTWSVQSCDWISVAFASPQTKPFLWGWSTTIYIWSIHLAASSTDIVLRFQSRTYFLTQFITSESMKSQKTPWGKYECWRRSVIEHWKDYTTRLSSIGDGVPAHYNRGTGQVRIANDHVPGRVRGHRQS